MYEIRMIGSCHSAQRYSISFNRVWLLSLYYLLSHWCVCISSSHPLTLLSYSFLDAKYVVCNIRCHCAWELYSMLSLLFARCEEGTKHTQERLLSQVWKPRQTMEQEINHIYNDPYQSILMQSPAIALSSANATVWFHWIEGRKKNRIGLNWMWVISSMDIDKTVIHNPMKLSAWSIVMRGKSIKKNLFKLPLPRFFFFSFAGIFY